MHHRQRGGPSPLHDVAARLVPRRAGSSSETISLGVLAALLLFWLAVLAGILGVLVPALALATALVVFCTMLVGFKTAVTKQRIEELQLERLEREIAQKDALGPLNHGDGVADARVLEAVAETAFLAGLRAGEAHEQPANNAQPRRLHSAEGSDEAAAGS